MFTSVSRSLPLSAAAGALCLGVLGAMGSGCGGGAGVLSDGGTAGVMVVNPTLLIDDFEDGNSQIAQVGGRNGGWFSYGDATPGGSLIPMGETAPETIPGGRGASHHALRVTSTGFLDWGSGVSTAVHWGVNDAGVPGLLPYDASTFKGVTFFARVGDTSAAIVRVQFSDQFTRPEGGMCVPNGPPGQACYDDFGVDLPDLSTTWQAYQIPFVGLSQRGFGVPRNALDPSTLYEIAFAFPPAVVTDFWLDDIRFYQ